MAYQAAKRMTLAGVKVVPGDRLGEEVLTAMPLGKIDSLRRVGYIVEVVEAVDTPKPYKSQKRDRSALKTTKDEEAVQVDASFEEAPVKDEPSDGNDTAVSSDPEAST